MKEDEHRQLEWVCEHEFNAGEKHVLPQALAFGLSWSTASPGLDNACDGSSGCAEMQLP